MHVTPVPTLRVARPTDQLEATVRFYTEGLGFTVLAQFHDHAGFDGAIVGHEGSPYHLEFTHRRGHQVGRAPTLDHLIVLYLPDAAAYTTALARLGRAGVRSVPSYNPYWDQRGRTFEDPDGYRVVLCSDSWSR